ncbi:MAG: hypothetical protein KGH78_01420, partial [Candidatus Micrarchaeota archaeon]|nr:hypothetical protein [Candidatus Micrarchaeota archaeon]
MHNTLEIDFSDLGIKVLKEGERLYIKGSHHRIKHPILDGKLALFLGILWGDGCIYNRVNCTKFGDWRIVI